MQGDFQEEIQTKEILDQLHRRILTLESREKDLQLMITFNAGFQMKLEVYGGTPMYQKNNARTIFLHPWFSDMSQEEPYKIWKRM